jgi:hypothetical protein
MYDNSAGLDIHRSLRRIPAYVDAPRPMKMGNIASPWHYDAMPPESDEWSETTMERPFTL